MDWIRRNLPIALVLAVGIGGAVGYYVVQSRTTHEARGTAAAAENAISLETTDWTYNVPLDVHWRGADGAWRESGRPECLPPGSNVEIRFWWTDVSIERSAWREVLAVDCRGSELVEQVTPN